MDVDGGNTNSHTLTGLTNGQTYTISIVGTSSSSAVTPSSPVSAGTVGLGKIYIVLVYIEVSHPYVFHSIAFTSYSNVSFVIETLFHSSISSSTQ